MSQLVQNGKSGARIQTQFPKPGPPSLLFILQCFLIPWFESIIEIRGPQYAALVGSGFLPELEPSATTQSRTLGQDGGEAFIYRDSRHLSTKSPTSTRSAQMRSLEEAIMILLHPLCWRLMLSAGGKGTLSFANMHYNYACLSRYYNLGLKKAPFWTSSAALVKHYRCVII